MSSVLELAEESCFKSVSKASKRPVSFSPVAYGADSSGAS